MFWSMEAVKRDPRGQGDQGERSAMLWFGQRGAAVFMPVFHSPDFDLIADWGQGLARVQVKTSTCFINGRWEVTLCTRGGNRSWNGLVKYLDRSRYDYLFVVVRDGRRWFVPASNVGGGAGILLGGPKYAPFEIDAGEPLGVPSIDSAPLWRDSRAVKGDGL
jgi:PD-(D/E)XK endonuclease